MTGARTRRRTAWADQRTALVLGTGVLAIEDLLAGWKAAGGSLEGVTVGRIHLNWSPVSGVGASTTANPFIEWGIIVDDTAETNTTIPNPSGTPYADWMINRTDFVAYSATQPAWINGPGSEQVDIRSKRKLGQIQRTLWLVANGNVPGATSLTVRMHSRVLLLLP